MRPLARIPIALAAIALVVPLGGCRAPAAPQPSSQAVKIAVVARASATSARRYSAHIEPATRVDLAFKVGGYVEALAKTIGVDGKPRVLQEGDPVTTGRELASVRRTDYAQRVAEAKAALAQAQAAADQAQLDVDRDAKLVDGNSIPAAELDAARTRLATAKAVLAGARARVDEAETALADTSLRAPMDGVIVRRGLEVGALAAPGAVAFSIADVSSVKAVFGVPDTALANVRLGATQAVTSEALPGVELRGRITRLAPSADPRSRTFEAEVLIPNADGRLKMGMIVALSLEAHDAAQPLDAPLVPLAAIVRPPKDAGAFAVFVVEDAGGAKVARLRVVELGDYLGRAIPVRRGLVGGEPIVVQGAGLLADGERVEVVP